MKNRIFYIFLILFTSIIVSSQEVVNIPERTPEQEASNQTDKLQKELNLSQEQSKKVYDINLFYARQRQQSNSRAEATQRIRNKNEDLKKVLTEEQYKRLQNKHYNRSSYYQPDNTLNSFTGSNATNIQKPLSSSEHRNLQEERKRKNENTERSSSPQQRIYNNQLTNPAYNVRSSRNMTNSSRNSSNNRNNSSGNSSSNSSSSSRSTSNRTQ